MIQLKIFEKIIIRNNLNKKFIKYFRKMNNLIQAKSLIFSKKHLKKGNFYLLYLTL